MNKSPQELTIENIAGMVDKRVRVVVGNVSTQKLSEEPFEGVLVNYEIAHGSGEPDSPGSLYIDIGKDRPRDISILEIIKLSVIGEVVE